MYCDETGSKGETQTVFVIDDDTLLRQALCSFLESEGFIVKNFATASAFLDAYRPEWQGCLLLDLSLPEIDGLELQQRLSVRGARLPIIFLTGKGDIPKAVQALKEGAVDFLQKPSTQDEILDRVRRALAEAPRGRNSDPGTSDILERYERLTQREREVMSLITHHPFQDQIQSTNTVQFRRNFQ